MGSIANLIVAEKSKSTSKKHELTFLQHLKFCLWSTPLTFTRRLRRAAGGGPHVRLRASENFETCIIEQCSQLQRLHARHMDSSRWDDSMPDLSAYRTVIAE